MLYNVVIFMHFILWIHQFDIGLILYWLFSRSHEIASRAACDPWTAGWKSPALRIRYGQNIF